MRVKDLPDYMKVVALNYGFDSSTPHLPHHLEENSISGLFIFSGTEEGHKFWSRISYNHSTDFEIFHDIHYKY